MPNDADLFVVSAKKLLLIEVHSLWRLDRIYSRAFAHFLLPCLRYMIFCRSG